MYMKLVVTDLELILLSNEITPQFSNTKVGENTKGCQEKRVQETSKVK